MNCLEVVYKLKIAGEDLKKRAQCSNSLSGMFIIRCLKELRPSKEFHLFQPIRYLQ